ncbi:hypothetical protein NXH64_10815 [Butyrivibrio fibrisolvens]|uniref:kelch repeat-containing protein n=1 Tax=Pseudobutyrivibrio ruminis TaxID=46206 RepID=UPI0004179B81|nr:kelch repeat-containing protein [Pseudobutyrivibrio ruminis]MDC7279990.1 hypothetical protein [Butyrivibrio fibrisolvens]
MNSIYIKTVSERCGHTIIQVDDNGQNSIVLFGGANQDNTRDNVDGHKSISFGCSEKGGRTINSFKK